MQILTLILLAVIAAMLYKKFLPANSSDWLVLEWHKLDAAKSMWDNKAPVHIEFVPIIGWEYDHWGYKYSKPTPITPPAYRVKSRLDSTTEYETVSYWVRDGAVFEIDAYWSHGGDFWKKLSDHAIAGHKIELHGSVPDCCHKRFFDILANILAIMKQQQKQGDT
ncbi:MAG TPA: hypothetical protein VF893_06065 [Candidatus Bathyarchaeia archaeon]